MSKTSNEVSTTKLHIKNQYKQRKRDLKAKEKLKDDKSDEEIDFTELQDKIKRQGNVWREDFDKHLTIFKKLFLKFREEPSKEDEKVIKYTKFMTHICNVFQKDLAFLPTELIDLLEQSYNILHPNLRLEVVQNLRMMYTKKVVSCNDILPVFFRLFRCEDKALRQYLFSAIIGVLKLINKRAKNIHVNKAQQNFVYDMIKDPQETAAKKSLLVMIELYKKKIWNDENTVNIIGQAALQQNSKLCVIACKFFLLLNYDEPDSEDSGSDIETTENKLHKSHITAKMTRKKKANLKKQLKLMKRKRDRRNQISFHTDFLPIDLIRCPQEYTDKLFYRLRKSNESLDIKMHMMRFIARMIGRHKLIMFNFYPFIAKYINTHAKPLSDILAVVAESTHINVPHDEVKPLVDKICDQFIHERASMLNMTMSINAITQTCSRNPNTLSKPQLQYIISYKSIKNKSINLAIKTLINLYRDIKPDMLEKKQLGKDEAIELRKGVEDSMVENTRVSTIEGIDLLKEHLGLDPSVNLMATRLLTEDDFKLIKQLKIKKKAQEAQKKLQLELSLNNYEIIDERFKPKVSQDVIGQGQDVDEVSSFGEGEFDADDENSEDEHSNDGNVENPNLANEVSEGEDSENEESEEENSEDEKLQEGKELDEDAGIKQNEKRVTFGGEEFEILDEGPTVMRSDGIEYVPPTLEDRYQIDESDISVDSEDEPDTNPHNFVEGQFLDTYKRRRIENKSVQILNNLNNPKQRFKKPYKHDLKNRGKTNKEKQKNKPLQMVKPKKIKMIQRNFRSTKERMKELKTKLGKIREGKLRVKRKKLIRS